MKTIIIIRFSSLGDIVLTNRVYKTLKTSLPGVRLVGVVLKAYSRLFDANPYVDKVIAFDPRKEKLGALITRLRDLHPEIVIDLHDSLRSRSIRARLGASRILVYRKLSLERLLLVLFKINLLRGSAGVAERYLEACAPLVPEAGARLHNFFEVPDVVLSKVREKWLRKYGPGFIAVCREARWNTKRWPFYDTLIEILVRKKARRVVVIGERADDSLADLKASHPGKFLNLAGKLDIVESAAVIKMSSLFISNDSGLMHIADAMKKKTISIWGPTVPEFGFKPLNGTTRIVSNATLKCRPCSLHGSNRCPLGHFRCMLSIDPQKIADLAVQT